MRRELPYRIEEHGEGYLVEVEGGVVRSANVGIAIASFGLGHLVAAAFPPVAPLSVILGLFGAIGFLGDALRPPKLYLTPAGITYRTLWPTVGFTIPWEQLEDARLSGTTLNLVRKDGTTRRLWLFTLPEEQRTWVEIEIRRRLGAPEGIERLPGQTTADGLVVPLGRDPAFDRAIPLVLGMLASFVIASLVATVLTSEGGAPWPILGMTAVALALLALGMREGRRHPDGLRISNREIAVMRGTEVLWRRALHEITGARVGLKGVLTLEAADGEFMPLDTRRLATEQTSPEQLARVILDLAAEARERPEATAEPDPRLVALVRRTTETP